MDSSSRRAMYLESIRGIGAMQVLLLHCASAFVPALTKYDMNDEYANFIHKSPLFFLYDGYSAVYIFFILSGIVLTFYFGTESPRPIHIFPRIMRLMIPAVAAVLFGVAVKAIFGAPNLEAGSLVDSEWLRTLWLPPEGVGFILKDALVNAVWLGYGDASTWSLLGTGIRVDPMSAAYAAPLWTLSLELQGSVLVLLLCIAFRRRKSLWAPALAISFALLFRSHFSCFLVGHLIGVAVLHHDRHWDVHPLVSIALINLGVYLCISEDAGQLAAFDAVCRWELFPALRCLDHTQKIAGSILVFSGVFSSAPLRKALETKYLCRLGKLSFSLYLIHWPIVFGLGSSLALMLARHVPAGLVGVSTVCLVVPICLGAARLFSVVDDFSIRASRRWRRAIDAAP
ncbi:MAG: acyltransferase [Phyllobacteriaceae bacterium]|nr:acyltransferase [Phyllobacteriaceae bacterium]